MESLPEKKLPRVQGRDLPCSPEQGAFFHAVTRYVSGNTHEDAVYRELKARGETLSVNSSYGNSDWSKVKTYSYMLTCDEVWAIPDSLAPKRRYRETAAEKNARPLGYVVASLAVILAFYIFSPVLHFLQTLSGGFFIVGVIALGPFLFMGAFGAVVSISARNFLSVKEVTGWPAHSSLMEDVNRAHDGEKNRLRVSESPDGLYRGRPTGMRFFSGCAEYLCGDYLGVEDTVSYGVAMSISCVARVRIFKTGRCHWIGARSTSIDWKPCPIPDRLMLIGVTAESDAPDRIFGWLQQIRDNAIAQIFGECLVETLSVCGEEIVAFTEGDAIHAAERERTRLLLESMNSIAESLEKFFDVGVSSR